MVAKGNNCMFFNYGKNKRIDNRLKLFFFPNIKPKQNNRLGDKVS